MNSFITKECRGGVSPPLDDQDIEKGISLPTNGDKIKNRFYKGEETSPLQKNLNLGNIIAFYKYQTTKLFNKISGFPGTRVWQRNYYEHIIRKNELNKIRNYIKANPFKWEQDEYNPVNLKEEVMK